MIFVVKKTALEVPLVDVFNLSERQCVTYVCMSYIQVPSVPLLRVAFVIFGCLFQAKFRFGSKRVREKFPIEDKKFSNCHFPKQK